MVKLYRLSCLEWFVVSCVMCFGWVWVVGSDQRSRATLSLGGPPKDHPSRSSWLKNENLSASPRPRRCARAHPVERGLPRQLGGRGTHSPCEARGLWQVRVDMQLSSGRFWSTVNMGRFQRTIARCATPQPLPHARRASSSYILLTCPFCSSRMSTRARKCMKLIVSRLGGR